LSRVRSLIIILSALLLGVSLTAAQGRALPRFEPTDCQFNDDFFDVTCGSLIVPEDRANPNSIEIRLHVAIFASTSANPAPDPVVYLEGGPGGDALYFIEYSFPVLVEPLLDKRDVIVFDQRGTGYSFPRLDCPEVGNLQYDILDENLPADENIRLTIEALDVCRMRLESRGYNLAAYNSAENAADLADLRVALGYESWNLYGISYGTRLALTTLRDYPEGIRSVVIDSVLPPQVSLFDEITANADRAFNTLFLNCTRDPVCRASYPYLGSLFVETVTRLNTEPAQMYINHPLTGREYEVLVDGNRLVALTFHALYSVDLIPLLPRIIA
jgi:pimeloyl-ACP methyl ester carboxylesterase